MREREWLEGAATAKSFTAARNKIEDTLKPKGMRFDESYHPIAIKGKTSILDEKPSSMGFNYKLLAAPKTEKSVYGIRAFFDDDDSVTKLKDEHPDEVVGVFADPPIYAASSYCGDSPVGTSKDVARKLGLSALKRKNITGKGVRVAIVDTGINHNKVRVAGGWTPPGTQYEPGSAEIGHGSMCAWDVKISAPDATILDYALLKSRSFESFGAFLSDAVAAYSSLIDLIQTAPGPLVVNNSWVIYDRADDAPIGSPENYSANPNHPFNQIVGTLVGAGADVLFCSGNCGKPCSDERCGANDRGPGASIHGANSHPDVITVAAVTIDHRRLGYSSQGPGGLHQRKPDVAAYSHFDGSRALPDGIDSGTSASCPVAAGAIAALRQKFSNKNLEPAAMKAAIQRTAIDVGNNGWDYDVGFGIINTAATLKYLS